MQLMLITPGEPSHATACHKFKGLDCFGVLIRLSVAVLKSPPKERRKVENWVTTVAFPLPTNRKRFFVQRSALHTTNCCGRRVIRASKMSFRNNDLALGNKGDRVELSVFNT